MSKKQYFILSLTLFLIYSCASDDTSGPSPATIVGSWSSGELSYHSTDDCLNQGQDLVSFVNSSISSNIGIQAQIVAEALCVNDADYESCLAEELEDQIALYSAVVDSSIYYNLISGTFSYNNMTLVINEGESYETQYDGSCINIPEDDIYDESECDFFAENEYTEWDSLNEQCNIIDETYCGIVGATWDNGWVGSYDFDGENYILNNFNNNEATTKTLVFDGNDLFIVLSTVGDQCLCSTSTPSESSTDCIDADDCIWLESHCISLNFSK